LRPQLRRLHLIVASFPPFLSLILSLTRSRNPGHVPLQRIVGRGLRPLQSFLHHGLTLPALVAALRFDPDIFFATIVTFGSMRILHRDLSCIDLSRFCILFRRVEVMTCRSCRPRDTSSGRHLLTGAMYYFVRSSVVTPQLLRSVLSHTFPLENPTTSRYNPRIMKYGIPGSGVWSSRRRVYLSVFLRVSGASSPSRRC
jgi:hypothetical protein